MKQYSKLVFIGRFQPFHNGHKRVIETALEMAENVIVLVGSMDESPSLRNPFTFREREWMIRQCFERVEVRGVPDYPYDENKWLSAVQDVVENDELSNRNIGLIGHSKDHSSYYLKKFPKWGNVDVENHEDISATPIREAFFLEERIMSDCIPSATTEFLKKFKESERYERLRNEYRIIEAYKKSWECAPYPPTFMTVDAVVTQAGHVLLVKRKSAPGKGLWALPGGFIEQHEKLEDSMIRELREETKIKIPEKVLRGSIKKREIFDDPHRSSRGRTITTAFHIDLGDSWELPKIKAASDAQKAEWVSYSEARYMSFFEDHKHIIDHMTGIMF